jgi:Tol biopolymer transport system component
VERYDANSQIDIWALDLPRGVFSRLTLDPLEERDPVWSSDSKRIAYNINTGGRHELMEMTIGSGHAKSIFSDGVDNRLDDWSSDDTLVYHTRVGTQFFALPPGQPRKSQKLYETAFQSDEMRVSPDGKWIAFGSNESGRWEVYIAAFPSFSGRKQISTQGGVEPHWSRDGRELFFLSPDGDMMAVDVSLGSSPETGTPKKLFKTSSVGPAQTHDFAVSPDGQRFYVKEHTPEAARAGINVVVNWPALLKAKE